MDLSTCTNAQRESIQHLDGELFIAAGAGSGKTFTLQNRIAYALSPESGSADGTPKLSSVDEVLAITFMEKAAAEIKARVRSALRAEGNVEEALKVDAAWISTIHGMCSRILHEYALEAHLDPAFTVLPEFDERRLRAQAIDQVLEAEREGIDQYGAAASPYSALFEEFGVASKGQNDASVLGMVDSLLSKSASFERGLDAIELCQSNVPPGAIARRLLVAYEEAYAFGEDLRNPKKPQTYLVAALEASSEAIETLTDFLLTGEDSVEKLASVLSGLRSCRADAFGRNEEAKEVARGLSETLDWAVRNVNALLASVHAPALVNLAKRVDAVYQGMLDERCALDNNGLLKRTHALLNDHPEIAAGFQSRFKLVMVDEFQDTNQMQVDLIEKVAGAGALCTVGDAQQSIYRFNGADVSVFNRRQKRVRELVAAHGAARESNLNANFRSHADILAFVRKVCGQPEVFGDSFLDLEARRKEEGRYKGAGPRIELQLISYEKSKSSTHALEAEAAGIAERFAALRDAGHTASEMVVLLGTTSNVDMYAQALRKQGFECVVGGGRSFFSTEEVRVVRNLLTALANPADSEALFAVLTSPMVRLSADDFLILSTKEREGKLKRRNLEDGLFADDVAGFSDSLSFALSLFNRAFARIKYDLPSRIVMDMLLDSGWLTCLQQQGAEGTSIAANILKAVRIVENLEQKPGYRFARVARDFSEMADTVREAPASLSVTQQNAVKLMTIHKSKGLEFPIVAVASYEPRERNSEVFSMTARDGKIYASLSAKESKVEANGGKALPCKFAGGGLLNPENALDAAEFACAIRNYDWNEELAEAQRKFYVACTRASEYLLVCGLVKAGNSKASPTERYAATPMLDLVRLALMGPEVDFPEETGEINYGGSATLRFTRCCYTPERPFEYEDAVGEGQVMAPSCRMVPQQEAQAVLLRQAASARNDVFSYSSIAPHEDHLPFEERDDVSSASSGGCCPVVESDEGSVVYEGEIGPSATDVGSAFHRIAQLAVLRMRQTGSLELPPCSAVDSLARRYDIEGDVRKRLDAALNRWFSSDVARKVEQFDRARAEVPFMVAVPAGVGERGFNVAEAECLSDDGGDAANSLNKVEGSGACGDGFVVVEAGERGAEGVGAVWFMEGEIDLLAETKDGSCAFVVDYKTGGSDVETQGRLHDKHKLQATCYAYALLTTREYQRVDFAFVRVEREDSHAPGQPQVVRYTFEAEDAPTLRDAIARAYEAARTKSDEADEVSNRLPC